MTIYFGSSTDEDLIAELEQRGYFCAKAQEPVSHRYRFIHPISGEPVWRDSSSMWNGQCVQEVQQLFAAPILPVREPDWLLKTTQDLARAIARDNFPDVPQWEVFDDLPGVISQIDNMVCGMERKKPVREPLSDNTIAALRQAIAQPATTEWTVIAPDGTRFTGPTPLKAALPASKYRLEIDPVAAVKFMEIIDQEADRQEAEQCMRDYGTLDCPACGGSGHIGDVKQPAQVPAGSIRLWDTQWASIVNHDNAYNGWSTNDAVNHAVRMTERYIAANVAQNNLPPLPAAPEVK